MFTMSGPLTTVNILFSILPASVLTSRSSRSLASWEMGDENKTGMENKRKRQTRGTKKWLRFPFPASFSSHRMCFIYLKNHLYGS